MFLEAWRTELPWLRIASSVSIFVQCNVCDWLKLQIDQTPRDQPLVLAALKARLGSHYSFQSAQRLKQGQLEEICRASKGDKWMMKIDKMESQAINLPVIWSQQATPLFKLGNRLTVAVNGSMWAGTDHTSVHMRTLFLDTPHDAEMQISTILKNLHEAAMLEKRLPYELIIGSDNTPKETKNKYFIWFCIWLLAAMATTGCPLWSILYVSLLVGHTHDNLDRFFSRLRVAMAGHDVYTLQDLEKIIEENLRGFDVRMSHLTTVWKWHDLEDFGIPPCQGLRNIHTMNVFYHNGHGIYVKWKQYMTSEEWSAPVLLLPEHRMAEFARFRPRQVEQTFRKRNLDEQSLMTAWLDKFETSLREEQRQKHAQDTKWLRRIINRQDPVYTDGPSVDTILRDLESLGRGRSVQDQRPVETLLPHDAIVQLFAGADHPPMPVDALVSIPRVWEHPPPSNVVAPGACFLFVAILFIQTTALPPPLPLTRTS